MPFFYILFLYPRLFIPLNTLYITDPVYFFRPAVFSPFPAAALPQSIKIFLPKSGMVAAGNKGALIQSRISSKSNEKRTRKKVAENAMRQNAFFF